ncbi:MAG TPA: transposase [Methylomirabilota bacterium]|nr:transposase [Methylomirabilota bacterium]
MGEKIELIRNGVIKTACAQALNFNLKNIYRDFHKRKDTDEKIKEAIKIVHKGILMRQALAKGGLLERVHLVWLPPYTPDYNPIEHVWNTTKDKLSNKQEYTFQQTKQKFILLTNNQIFPYQI